MTFFVPGRPLPPLVFFARGCRVARSDRLIQDATWHTIHRGREHGMDKQAVLAARRQRTKVARGAAGWGWGLDRHVAARPRHTVGERGGSLSLGQRQIVALSRVLLQDPSIFILDEATASIDPLTETQIQEGLDLVLLDRTSIVIAHRLSTIRNADRIIMLRQGAIIEQGDHDTLLARGGHYA